MAIYYTGTLVGNQVNFSTGQASAVASDVKQHIINQLVTGGETGLAPSNKAVYDFGVGLSGYLSTNAGGIYQISSQSPGWNTAQINLTGTVTGASFNDFVTISGVSGVGINVSNDIISVGHTDTSFVENLTVNAAVGSAITGISFTYDTFGHVLSATGTTAVLVRNQIASGVTATAPSEAAVHTLSGYLTTNAGGSYELSAQSPGTNVAQINLTGRVSGSSFNDFVLIEATGGIDVSVSTAPFDRIYLSHADTSSVSNLSVSTGLGQAVNGIQFTYDTYGHVLTAAATSSILVQDFIFSGVHAAPSQGAVYQLSGYLADNAGGSYQISAKESLDYDNSAQINLTGRVSGSAFNDFIKIKGTGAIQIGVSTTGDDTIYIGHSDTSAVATVSVAAAAGSAVQGIDFTFDNYGHVATASATTQVIVRNQIQSGVATTAPSEGAVYSLSGSLQSQINTANALTLQSVTNNGSVTTNGISIGGNLVASGNVTLGNDASDTLTINAGPVVLTNAVTGGDALIFGPNDGSKVSIYKSDPSILRIEGGLIITGNLTVQGTTTTIDSNVVSIGDSLITLNADFTGSVPSENGGIEIERGTQTNTALLWNEGTDRWTFTNNGTGYFNIPVTSEYATYDIVVASGGSNDAIIRITGSNGDVNDILVVGSNGILVTDNGVNTIEISHQDTSAASSITAANSIGSAVQSFSGLLDTYGHVTGLQVQSVNLDTLYPRTGQVTLDYVTTNGASTTNDIIVGGLTVSGSQYSRSEHFVLHALSTDDAATEMFLNDISGRISIPVASIVSFKGQISAYHALSWQVASWSFEGSIANRNDNTALVGPAYVTKLSDDTNGAWEVYIDADNTFDSLKIQGKGSYNSYPPPMFIRWTASVTTTVTRIS